MIKNDHLMSYASHVVSAEDILLSNSDLRGEGYSPEVRKAILNAVTRAINDTNHAEMRTNMDVAEEIQKLTALGHDDLVTKLTDTFSTYDMQILASQAIRDQLEGRLQRVQLLSIFATVAVVGLAVLAFVK